MFDRLRSTDVSDIPAVREIAEEVDSTNEPRLLKLGSVDLALMIPLPRKRGRPRGKALTADDPLMALVGVAASGLGDVSENKHKYLGSHFTFAR